MCPFLGDEALNSTRKHAGCTTTVRTKKRDFWTDEIAMIPRKKPLFQANMIPITPRSTI
jgi:hypothetical protein